MTTSRRILALLIAGGLLAGASARAEGVLRVAPHADLKVMDPHTNTATITAMYAHLVYDTLFAVDAAMVPHPQMVESYTVSDDRLAYAFVLRPGLRFHDDQPVTARDVVPSIKRWMVRDGMGQKMAEFVASMSVIDDKRFEIRLKEPFPFVEAALASSNGMVPVIMRAKDAATDPYQMVTETIGSGPFRFVRGEWVPGVKLVFEKNPGYVPRAEPPNGLAGGKVVKLDRVEWIVLPDPLTKASALQKGEIDMIDQLPLDQAPLLEKIPGVTVKPVNPLDNTGIIRPNHLFPPFDNPKARLALALMVDQKEYLHAAEGDDPKWWRECWSFFICGTANGTEVGAEAVRKRDPARAKQLLAEAGYKGEPIVVLDAVDQPVAHSQALVVSDEMKRLGLNVEIQSMDWGTLVTRRAIKEPLDKGGWNIFATGWVGADLLDPAINPTLRTNGEKGHFGWPSDDKIEALRNQWLKATTFDERKKLAEDIQLRAFEIVPYIPTGQYFPKTAYHKNIKGVIEAPAFLFWNVEKV